MRVTTIKCNRCGEAITKEDFKNGSQNISIPVYDEKSTTVINIDLHKECLGISLGNMFKDFKIEPEVSEIPKCDHDCDNCDIDECYREYYEDETK